MLMQYFPTFQPYPDYHATYKSPFQRFFRILTLYKKLCASATAAPPSLSSNHRSWALGDQVKELEKLHLVSDALSGDIDRRAKQLRARDLERHGS